MILTSDIVAALQRAGLAGPLLVAACRELEAVGHVASMAASQRPNMNEADMDGRIERSVPIEPANADTRLDTIGRQVAMARKALGLAPALSSAARRVGGAIVDHFNRITGQCDPSEGRMARLLGLSQRTVRRALRELEAAQLVTVRLHGGHSHRNAYLPDWSRLSALATAWDEGMKMNNAAKSVRIEPDKRTNAASEPDNPGRQTHIKNPDIESGDRGKRRAISFRLPNPRQREFLYPLGPPAASEVAAERAKKRVWDDVHQHHAGLSTDSYVQLVSSITDPVWNDATAAETAQRGSGLRVVLKALAEPRARQGPEAATG